MLIFESRLIVLAEVSGIIEQHRAGQRAEGKLQFPPRL
jgi:hypothetical protein